MKAILLARVAAVLIAAGSGAAWVATVSDTLEQVTDRIESKLQGDAEPRLPEELHERGPDDDLRQPEGFHAPV